MLHPCSMQRGSYTAEKRRSGEVESHPTLVTPRNLTSTSIGEVATVPYKCESSERYQVCEAMATLSLSESRTLSLPTEIWLQIAAHCEPKTLWCSVRKVNRQLFDCAEQCFEEQFLPLVTFALPVAIPTYDMRNQTRGKAVFCVDTSAIDNQSTARISFSLARVEPELYRRHFLDRWRSLCSSAENGRWSQRIPCEMTLAGTTSTAVLRAPEVDPAQQMTVDQARVSFEWRVTMTTFLR